MELQTERWYAAIAQRHSRRSFDGRPLPPEALDALREHCARFRPFADARAVVVDGVSPDVWVLHKEDRGITPPALNLFAGVAGSYGRITGAPAALVFVGAAALGTEHHVGYTAQAVILEATALGLDTCWVGGFFSPSRTAEIVDLAPDERVLAVSPVGHAEARVTRRERLLFRTGGTKKRLELQNIAVGLLVKDWPGWAVAGVRAVRPAPSAMNRQPWRFRLEGDGVVLGLDGYESGFIAKRLDCGIAMLHFELGVCHFGRAGAWEPVEGGAETDVARWRPA
jgi:nitroreductase